MEDMNLVLAIAGFMSNGEVAIESTVIGEPHETFNVLVYGLVSAIRKIVCEDTVAEDVPHSNWAINEYSKECLQEVFQSAYETLNDEVQPLRVEEIEDEEGEE